MALTRVFDDSLFLRRWGKQEDQEEDDADKPDEPVEKPNFGLSGALAKDQTTGNVQNGVVMKWSEPPEARVPQKRYRFYVFKYDALICKSYCILYLRFSSVSVS